MSYVEPLTPWDDPYEEPDTEDDDDEESTWE